MAYTDTANIPLHMPVPGSKEPAQIALLNENCVTLSNHDHTTGKALAIGRMRSGLAANRPAAGSAGNVYFSTDTGVFNADTGTAWVQFLTSGGQATVTGWTLVDPIVRDILSFGAKPTGTVDATITRTGAGALRVDTNLGVGIAPTAWGSPYVTTQVGVMALYGQPASVGVGVRANSYYDGTNNLAIITGAATDVSLANGTFNVYTAPSVAAGAIQTMTQRIGLAQTGTLTLTPAAGVAALVAQGTVGVGATPAAWRSDLSAVQVQQAAFMASGTGAYFTSNVYYDAGGTKGMVAGAGSQILLSSQMQFFATQANAAGPGGAVTLVERMAVGNNGTLTLTPAAGATALIVPSLFSVAPVASTTDVQLGASGASAQMRIVATALVPFSDAFVGLGSSAIRWASVWASSGVVSGSSFDQKHDLSPLDPTACAQAVLDTDWISFVYNDPPQPEGEQYAEAYQKMLAETAPARHQNGYVLGSPDHKVSDLFGLSDRRSKNDGADLAVVACALQAALRRLAALEGQSGPSGQQPAS
jgi:hypothetical protein